MSEDRILAALRWLDTAEIPDPRVRDIGDATPKPVIHRRPMRGAAIWERCSCILIRPGRPDEGAPYIVEAQSDLAGHCMACRPFQAVKEARAFAKEARANGRNAPTIIDATRKGRPNETAKNSRNAR